MGKIWPTIDIAHEFFIYLARGLSCTTLDNCEFTGTTTSASLTKSAYVAEFGSCSDMYVPLHFDGNWLRGIDIQNAAWQ